MDRTSAIVVVICFALLILWFPLMNSMYPPQEEDAPSTNQVDQAEREPVSKPKKQPTEQPSESSDKETFKPFVAPEKEAPEELLVLENTNAVYTFSSRGGGLKEVELKGYPKTIACGEEADKAGGKGVTLNEKAALPILGLYKPKGWLGKGNFSLRRVNNRRIVAEKTLTNRLQVVHSFELGSNYLVRASLRITNRSDKPITIPAHRRVIGTAAPVNPNDKNPGVFNKSNLKGIYWHAGAKTRHITAGWFANRKFGCLPGTPRSHYQGGTNLLWAAVHNRFFTVLTMPADPAPTLDALKIRLPLTKEEGVSAAPQSGDDKPPTGYQTAFVYPEKVLQPGQSWEKNFDIFAGPKKHAILSKFNDNQATVMNFGFLSAISKALLWSMNRLNGLGLPFGWAIVTITIIIKVVFWPLTKAGTRSMKRMQALQPQMKELQEKYKDDPQKMNQKLMEFMKQNKVNPMGGCLPMLVQAPVFIGFLYMIMSAVELRGASFLWVCDLSHPDTVWTIPGIDFPLNPMPLLMAVTMLWQTQLTPAAPGMDPMQQKLMKYMPLIIVVFLYKFAAAMTLYWTVQNLLTVLQTKMTKAADEKQSAQGGTPPATPPKKQSPVPGGKKKKRKRG